MKSKIFSLVCCLLMMCAAAICVNKAIIGQNLKPQQAEQHVATPSDTLTVKLDGAVIIHTKYLSKASGYAGPVPLDVYVSADGIITDIQPLPNAETPGFFSRASSILEQWKGKNIHEIAPADVDAVSGATYSSNALKANVEAAVNFYLKDGGKTGAGGVMPLKMWIALAVTLAACIVPLFVKNKIYHNVQLLANVIVLGFWCGQFLDYALMLKYLSFGFSLPVGLTAIAMLVAAFIYPLFGRPQHYCSHICPLGSAQILMGKITDKKINLGPTWVKRLDWFRKILWAALMLLLWCDVLVEWMDLELFQAFMFQSASLGVIIAAVVFLLLSIVISRPYCRFVCPTGSLFKRAENIG